MFMNDCVWAVFCLSEEIEKFKGILVDHKNHKTQTVIENVQARLQDLTNVAAEFNGISVWQNWQTEFWNNSCLMDSPMGNLVRTDVHVFSDSVLCVGNFTTPLQASHGRQDHRSAESDNTHKQVRYHGPRSKS